MLFPHFLQFFPVVKQITTKIGKKKNYLLNAPSGSKVLLKKDATLENLSRISGRKVAHGLKKTKHIIVKQNTTSTPFNIYTNNISKLSEMFQKQDEHYEYASWTQAHGGLWGMNSHMTFLTIHLFVLFIVTKRYYKQRSTLKLNRQI